MSVAKQFSEAAQTVLAFANKESKRLHCDHVASEHLLLGVLVYGQGVGCSVLVNAGLLFDSVRSHIASAEVTPEVAMHGYRPSVHGVFRRSLAHADALVHPKIEPEHLVLGLLDETEGGAFRLLQHFGVDTAIARGHIIERIAR